MNQKILEKAVKKAVDAGWHTGAMDFYDNDDRVVTYYSQTENPLLFIFNHDFAKALWGEGNLKNWPRTGGWLPETSGPEYEIKMVPWAYHLQKMVTAEDPIKYLSDNM